jgi:signal transduction histidine kinase
MPQRSVPTGPVRRSQRAFTAAAFGFILALGAWWIVLLARLSQENHALLLQVHGDDLATRATLERRTWMIVGEGGSALVIIVALAGLSVKRARDETIQAARLEGLLVASTHELKTPITALRALLESLQSGALPPESAGPFVRRGVESCDRLEHLVEGILAFQKEVAGVHPTRERWSIQDLVEVVLAHRGEPDLDVGLGDASAATVLISRDAFVVILDNLLDNARKYSEAPARLRVRLDGRQVRLRVEDDGPGFEPSESEALFEPYTRGSAGRRQHGTGLGLYLARSLAIGQQGELTAHSDGPGRGATFELSLPVVP